MTRSLTDAKAPAKMQAPAPPRRRHRARRHRMLLFVLPALLVYVVIVIVPNAQGVWFSFTDYDGLNPVPDFIGIDNYVRFFQDPQTVKGLTNTITLAITTTIVENAIGLLLALALNSKIKSRHALRVVFFAPFVVITVVVSFLWQFIFTPEGPINAILRAVGLGALAHNWLGDPGSALWSICVIVVWQFAGYTMVIYLAGLQGVPEEQLEAAALDGASAIQRFWYVTRPLLAPALTVNLVLSLIRGFMIFDQIWVTTQGGPARSTDSLSTLIFRNGFQNGELGYAAAIAVALAVLVAAFALLQYRYMIRSGAAR